jgi:pilus assembly protein FimV
MNRPQKTKLIVALGGVLLAASALVSHAAGLGRLSVNSALGQPLSAEIELVSLLPGEFETLAARVASPEAYTDAKIDYSPLLRSLRFAVDKRADGKPILKITSATPINEPFLDVLVEMNWPSGKLVREYPFLLDPPGFNQARVAPPVASTAPPVVSSPSTVTSSPASPVSAPVVRREVISGDTYGPVKTGDTLNAIAQSIKPETVSLEQMLVALYRENRAAFIGNNMNRLKAGQILRVPSAADATRIAPSEAQREIKIQVADWKGYRDAVAGAVASGAAKPSGSAGAGKIAVAKPDAPAPAAASSDKLKIAKSDAGGKAGAAGSKGGSADQLNAVREEVIAKENQLKEANSRVADLEKQITDMRKLMELKGIPVPGAKAPDAKVAAKPDDKAKAPEAAKPAPPADAKVAQVAPAKPAEAPKAADTKAAPAKPAEPAKVAEAPKTDAPKADAPKVEPSKADAAKPADPAKPPTVAAQTPPKTPAKAPPPPPPEPSFIEEYGVALGGGAAALLGLGGLFAFMRSRKKPAKDAPNSQLVNTSSIMPSDMKPNTVTGNRAGGLVDTGNSSFLTDFDKTGPGMIDTDEVDPVAEAEVYIAYGRDAQAEEILKEAMTRDKNRHEIALKLLEIYHARKSPQAFEPVARELKDAIGVDNPMWAKVAGMGASIDPANALYGGSGPAFAATGVFPAGGAALAAGAAGVAGVAAASTPDLDFDLGFGDAPAVAPASTSVDTAAVASAKPDSLDFDLDLGTTKPAPDMDLSTPAAPAAPGSGLDFDLAFDAPAAPASSTAAAPAAPAEVTSFDFDLSALAADTPAKPADDQKAFATTILTRAPEAVTNAPAFEKTSAMNFGGISFDLDQPAGDSPGAAAAATKLELAKAYIEIGDAEGAKEILHEVTREGSAAQRDEAQKILAGI